MNTLLATTDNSGIINRNDFQYYEAITNHSKRTLMMDISRRYYQKTKKSYIGVYSIFPRIGQGVYTRALDRDTVFFDKEKLDSYDRENLYRLDIQHKNVIEETKIY